MVALVMQLEAAARWNDDKAAYCSRQLRREKNHDSLQSIRRDLNRHARNAYEIRQQTRRQA